MAHNAAALADLADITFYDGSIISYSELENQAVLEPFQDGMMGGKVYTDLKIMGTPSTFFKTEEETAYFKHINGECAGLLFSNGGPHYKKMGVCVWILGFTSMRDYKQKNEAIFNGADPKTVFPPDTKVQITLNSAS